MLSLHSAPPESLAYTHNLQIVEISLQVFRKKWTILECFITLGTGINSSDLVVLETHILYSLSKEKTAARFYMMQCTQSISEDKRIPVEDVVRRLVQHADFFC